MDTKISKTGLLSQLNRLQNKYDALYEKLDSGGILDFCDEEDRDVLDDELEGIEASIQNVGNTVDSHGRVISELTNKLRQIEQNCEGLERRVAELKKASTFRDDGEYTKLNKQIESLNEVNGRQAAEHVKDLDTIMRLQWQNQANAVKYEAVEAYLKQKGILAEFNEWVSRSSYSNVMETIKRVGIDPRKIGPM